MTDLTKMVEILAKQALGNQNSSQSGLGSIVGAVVSQLGSKSQNQNTNNSGLSGVLGSVLNQLGSRSNTSGTTSNNSNTTQALLIAVVPIILSWIQKQGGLQGALDSLKKAGFSSQVQNWVSPAEQSNQSVVPATEVQQLFSDQEIEHVAEQTQSSKQAIYGAISSVLPQIISSLTPKGEQTNHQEANQDIQNVLNLVSGFLKK